MRIKIFIFCTFIIFTSCLMDRTTELQPNPNAPSTETNTGPTGPVAKYLYVDIAYAGTDSDGTLQKPFKTIAEAIPNKDPILQTIIIVRSGIYHENVDLSDISNLTIQGENRDTVIFKNTIVTDKMFHIGNNTDNITLSNFTIQLALTSNEYIYIGSGTNNVILDNLYLDNPTSFGNPAIDIYTGSGELRVTSVYCYGFSTCINLRPKNLYVFNSTFDLYNGAGNNNGIEVPNDGSYAFSTHYIKVYNSAFYLGPSAKGIKFAITFPLYIGNVYLYGNSFVAQTIAGGDGIYTDNSVQFMTLRLEKNETGVTNKFNNLTNGIYINQGTSQSIYIDGANFGNTTPNSSKDIYISDSSGGSLYLYNSTFNGPGAVSPNIDVKFSGVTGSLVDINNVTMNNTMGLSLIANNAGSMTGHWYLYNINFFNNNLIGTYNAFSLVNSDGSKNFYIQNNIVTANRNASFYALSYIGLPSALFCSGSNNFFNSGGANCSTSLVNCAGANECP